MASLLDKFFNPFGLTEAAGQGLSILSGNQQSFDYQKELNDKMMEREDNAYQRAVADAKKAGLSPLSVNGGASANSMTSSRIDNSGTLGAALSFASQISSVKTAAEKARKDFELGKEANEIARMNAETARMNAEANVGLSGAKEEYQRLVTSLYPKIVDMNLNEQQATIDHFKNLDWYTVQKNDREREYVSSLIGVSEAQIKKLSAEADSVLAMILPKISNMHEDTLLKVAQKLAVQESTKGQTISNMSELKQYEWLEDFLKTDFDIKEATLKHIKIDDGATILRAISSAVGSAVQSYSLYKGAVKPVYGMFPGAI